MSKLLVGLLLYAVGIVVFAQSGIGMAPWDVLSDGLSHTLGISLGAAVLGVSVVLLAVRVPCGGETMSLQAVVYSHGLRPWLGDYPASLAYPLLLVGAVWLIGLPLYRKRIYVKI